MRLLHATTLEFKVFHDDQIPPYLILSHTWGSEEVSYQEMRFLQQFRGLPETLRNNDTFVAMLKAAAGLDISTTDNKSLELRSGYTKIVKTAEASKASEIDYFWIDTCCIDKSSSAELQEAINSMYRWYQHSYLCVVYFEDFGAERLLILSGNYRELFCQGLMQSRWFSRGWTLQELIAPRSISFYDKFWHHIGSKVLMAPELARATGIPEEILRTRDLSRASIAQKMSWAASRNTTRIEDVAYSMMGLFGVHMPMLYGEGKNAFRRLQEEIIRTTPDDSIFAWEPYEESQSIYSGLLASSPKDFSRCSQVNRGRGVFAVSNLGLRMEADMAKATPMQMGPSRDKLLYVCVLGANGKEDGKKFALLVRKLAPSTYTRLSKLVRHEPDQRLRTETMYFEHTPNIPFDFSSLAIDRFHLCYKFFDYDLSHLHFVSDVRPYGLWDPSHQTVLVPHNTSSYRGTSMEHVSTLDGMVGRCFFCVVELTAEGFGSRRILLRYSLVTGQVWCTIFPGLRISSDWLDLNAPEGQWRHALQRLDERLPRQNRDQDDMLTVSVRSGLHYGSLANIVTIELK